MWTRIAVDLRQEVKREAISNIVFNELFLSIIMQLLHCFSTLHHDLKQLFSSVVYKLEVSASSENSLEIK